MALRPPILRQTRVYSVIQLGKISIKYWFPLRGSSIARGVAAARPTKYLHADAFVADRSPARVGDAQRRDIRPQDMPIDAAVGLCRPIAGPSSAASSRFCSRRSATPAISHRVPAISASRSARTGPRDPRDHAAPNRYPDSTQNADRRATTSRRRGPAISAKSPRRAAQRDLAWAGRATRTRVFNRNSKYEDLYCDLPLDASTDRTRRLVPELYDTIRPHEGIDIAGPPTSPP